MRMKQLQPRRLRGYCTSKQWECPDTPEKRLPGQVSEIAHSVRQHILRILGFELGQTLCPSYYYDLGYHNKMLSTFYNLYIRESDVITIL